jgi:hypothetical protein
MKPRWMVYFRSQDCYPVALDSALDHQMLRDYCTERMLPGPWETIKCSNPDTAQKIADWLNAQAYREGE